MADISWNRTCTVVKQNQFKTIIEWKNNLSNQQLWWCLLVSIKRTNDGLLQDCNIAIANPKALDILQSCTKASKSSYWQWVGYEIFIQLWSVTRCRFVPRTCHSSSTTVGYRYALRFLRLVKFCNFWTYSFNFKLLWFSCCSCSEADFFMVFLVLDQIDVKSMPSVDALAL